MVANRNPQKPVRRFALLTAEARREPPEET